MRYLKIYINELLAKFWRHECKSAKLTSLEYEKQASKDEIKADRYSRRAELARQRKGRSLEH